MAKGKKTGGRVVGSVNRPKAPDVPTDVAAPVATPVATAAPPAPPAPANLVVSGARTREATHPGLRIRYESLDNLQEYERNANEHPPEQIALIERLMAKVGWTTPMGKAGGVLIYGHARRRAAMNLRDKGIPIPRNPDPNKGPVVDLSHLSAMERRAYRIADNESARKAVTDDVMLAEELEDMRGDDPDFDLSFTGLDEDRIDDLLDDGDSGADPDDVPEPPVTPVSRLGDVWLCGRHRLMCGNSTDANHIAALMQGAKADLCFTSPPYAEQRDYAGGGMPWDALMQGVFGKLPVTHEAQVLVNLGMVHRDGEWMPYWDGWIEWMRATGWRRFGWYVWDQGFGLPGSWSGRLAPSHEWVFHFNRVAERARKTVDKHPENIGRQGGSILRGKNGEKQHAASLASTRDPRKIPDSVIRITRQIGAVANGGDHPAVFPVALVSEMLTAFSDPGATVYEPFTGSGTQIISAEKNDRTCLGLEIAPAYVDVALRRFAAFAGVQPTLEATGRTYAQTEAERLHPPVIPAPAKRSHTKRVKQATDAPPASSGGAAPTHALP